jgi:hypothetical protein
LRKLRIVKMPVKMLPTATSPLHRKERFTRNAKKNVLIAIVPTAI